MINNTANQIFEEKKINKIERGTGAIYFKRNLLQTNSLYFVVYKYTLDGIWYKSA